MVALFVQAINYSHRSRPCREGNYKQLRVSVSYDALNLCLLGCVFSFRGRLLLWQVRFGGSAFQAFQKSQHLNCACQMSSAFHFVPSILRSSVCTTMLDKGLVVESGKQQAPISKQAAILTLHYQITRFSSTMQFIL